MYLLDTGILSELRRAKAGRADAGLASWAAGIDRTQLFLSVITLMELQSGVGRVARKDKPAGAALKAWIDDQILPAFSGRLLSVDAPIVRRRFLLSIADDRDALVAATAIEHGLTLVTRAAAAFKGAKLKLLDPSDYDADESADDADWRQAGRAGPLWLKNLFVRG
jgi:toxin FitB